VHTGSPGPTNADNSRGNATFRKGVPISIPERKLTEETCKKWQYLVADDGTHIAQYYRDNVIVSQKLRTPSKSFPILGESKKLPLYGQQLWNKGGKYLTVVEGEIDALTVSQLNDHKWPVVSVPNGASGAANSIRANLEWVSSFDSVVFMFDMDEPGQDAAKACAALLKPGRAKIAKLPHKDPNECLQKGAGKAVIDAFWRAETFRPDGILDGDQIWELLQNHKTLAPIASFPVSSLQALTRGMRAGEIITICAGTKIGKSEFAREVALHCIVNGLKVGYVALEESVPKTIYSLVGMKLNHIVKYEEKPLETPGFKEAYDSIRPNIMVYNHWGSTEEENLLSKLRYMILGGECKIIVLDHISIVVSGMETGDERRSFDTLMTRLRSLSEETGVVVILISHLKRPSGGVPLEEGGQTSLSLLRGSASIAQLSDTVIGLERNQQDEETKYITTVRLLACRFTGNSGVAGLLNYNKTTGRLIEIEPEQVEALTGENTNVQEGNLGGSGF